MNSVTRWLSIAGIGISLLQCCDCASSTALSVTPSTSWYGDDGDWSAISIRVGSPPQWLDVLVSTVSSETWVVGSDGCSDSTCITDRGKVFNQTKSTTWQEMGFFEFGVDSYLGNEGSADYGLDNLTFGTTGVILPSAIIGAFNGTGLINGTQYLLGLFGLGVVPGNFTNNTPRSALSALVESVGAISSHTYGYTAGAKYQQKGVPVSLTLGGYDANRFVKHNTSFNLNPSQQPEAYASGISVVSSASGNNWSNSVDLLVASDRVSAIIDSSTPYLWLPPAVCNRFASSLGLTYDNTLNLYTFNGNSSKHDALSNAQLTFTFVLSDTGSTGDLVNITLPYSAFDLQLSYPAIPDTTFGAANSTKYYFPLRQASTEAQYTIGRAFLQEAYLITDYERNTFSVHQAIHTPDAITNTSIVPIPRLDSTTFSGPPKTTANSKKLSIGAIIGIAVGGALLIAGIISFAAIWACRHRKVPKQEPSEESASISSTTPPTPTSTSFFSRFLRRAPPPSSTSASSSIHETTGDTTQPTEVSADITHERFELAAPLGPVELDSESGTLDGTTENGSSTADSSGLSAYERARRKLERRLTAAAQASRRDERYSFSEEKNDMDISPVAHYRPSDHAHDHGNQIQNGGETEMQMQMQMREVESPLVSPLEGPPEGFFGTLPPISPISPSATTAGFFASTPSPRSPNSPMGGDMHRAFSGNGGGACAPPPVYSLNAAGGGVNGAGGAGLNASENRRRFLLGEMPNVVYAGRLPGNVQLPRCVPRVIGTDGRTIHEEDEDADADAHDENRNIDASGRGGARFSNGGVEGGTNSSLGSGYTDIETRLMDVGRTPNSNGSGGREDLYGIGDALPISPIASSTTTSGSNSQGNNTTVSPLASEGTGTGSRSGGSSNIIISSSSEEGSNGSSAQGEVRRRVELIDGDLRRREMEIGGGVFDDVEGIGERRRLRGGDLVHVPQVAENRFSWEEERI